MKPNINQVHNLYPIAKVNYYLKIKKFRGEQQYKMTSVWLNSLVHSFMVMYNKFENLKKICRDWYIRIGDYGELYLQGSNVVLWPATRSYIPENRNIWM
jgi:hypothetical protein